MPDEDIELEDSSNLSTEEVDNTEVVEEPTAEVEAEDSQPQYTEAETKAYLRAKKAEAELKALREQLKTRRPPESTPSGLGSLTPIQAAKDAKAISDLVDDDIDFVATYADKFGVTLSEARRNKDVQAALKNRAEERRTAEATSTGTSKRGASKLSDEALLEKAYAGELPTDEESLMRIARARMAKKEK